MKKSEPALCQNMTTVSAKRHNQPSATKQNRPQAKYSDGKTELLATFNLDQQTVSFTLAPLGPTTLAQAISGSGARYANADESLVFWEHQGQATITKNGQILFQGDLISD